MQTIIANIKHSIRNNETVIIGGGEFSPNELRAIVILYNASNKALESLEFLWGGEPLGSLEFEAMNELKAILRK